MAFKMSEGSLFAVLLRSPWWYSGLIALVIISISLLVPTGQITVMVLSLSLPFLGIAGYAGYKQSQQPSHKRLLEVAEEARALSPAQIADKIAQTYTKERFDSEPFKGNAADLELIRGNRKLLLCSKRFKAANTGIQPLKQMVAAGENAEVTGYLYVTLGEVSDNARSYAIENDIELIQIGRLAEYFDGSVTIG